MKNVTISADEELLAWLRVEAARAGKSVSRYVGDMLAQKKAEADRYGELVQAGLVPPRSAHPKTQAEAAELWMRLPLREWADESGRLPTREELYREREERLLRRHERADLQHGLAEPKQEPFRQDVDPGPLGQK